MPIESSGENSNTKVNGNELESFSLFRYSFLRFRALTSRHLKPAAPYWQQVFRAGRLHQGGPF